MIGPHEDNELDLILDGKKSLAVFSDILPDNGPVPEEIIPDKAFAPYIRTGQIIRKQKDFLSRKNDTIRVVCFATPDQEWRIDTIFWIKEQIYKGNIFPNHADDIIVGRLLDYNNDDIIDFLGNREKFNA